MSDVIKLDLGVKAIHSLLGDDPEMMAVIRTHTAQAVAAQLARQIMEGKTETFKGEIRREASAEVAGIFDKVVDHASNAVEPEIAKQLKEAAQALVKDVVAKEFDVLSLQASIRDIFEAEMKTFRKTIDDYAKTYAEHHFADVAERAREAAFKSAMSNFEQMSKG